MTMNSTSYKYPLKRLVYFIVAVFYKTIPVFDWLSWDFNIRFAHQQRRFGLFGQWPMEFDLLRAVCSQWQLQCGGFLRTSLKYRWRPVENRWSIIQPGWSHWLKFLWQDMETMVLTVNMLGVLIDYSFPRHPQTLELFQIHSRSWPRAWAKHQAVALFCIKGNKGSRWSSLNTRGTPKKKHMLPPNNTRGLIRRYFWGWRSMVVISPLIRHKALFSGDWLSWWSEVQLESSGPARLY